MAAISALADDLKVLEDMSRSSEERTARTFEALHETLVHIAEKLERLEERGLEQDAPRAFGSRGAGQPAADAARARNRFSRRRTIPSPKLNSVAATRN